MKVNVRSVFSIGGSMGITLPSEFVQKRLIGQGTRLIITEESDCLKIETINPSSTEKLKELGLQMLLNKNKKGINEMSGEYKEQINNRLIRKGSKIK